MGFNKWFGLARNYLRVRGEYFPAAGQHSTVPELPPRARRIPRNPLLRPRKLGTTSACAENTQEIGSLAYITGNYLRVRGEYAAAFRSKTAALELPPCTRRIHKATICEPPNDGTTSACAENTVNIGCNRLDFRNYLRVRGKYNPARSTSQSEMELPPRARKIQSRQVNIPIGNGTTSACAENT